MFHVEKKWTNITEWNPHLLWVLESHSKQDKEVKYAHMHNICDDIRLKSHVWNFRSKPANISSAAGDGPLPVVFGGH